MAGNNEDSGDKTEQPTPKRLKDLRKKGQIPKTKDLTSTFGLIAWILLSTLMVFFLSDRIVSVFEAALMAIGNPSNQAMLALGQLATSTFIILVAAIVTPAILVSLAAEFGQVGAILSTEKLKPKFDNLNLGQGLKRMFSMDNLVELAKALVKVTLLLLIGWFVLKEHYAEFLTVPNSQPRHLGALLLRITFIILVLTILVFFFVATLDVVYQRHSFIKKNRMSLRDIRQEHKENEGDPHIKENRKETAREWAEAAPADAAKNATALMVNPTHLALALKFDEDEMKVPLITGKGEGRTAQQMRLAAQKAGVPIIRDIRLVRKLYGQVAPADPVPKEFFNAIAEIIVWANHVKENGLENADKIHDRPT